MISKRGAAIAVLDAEQDQAAEARRERAAALGLPATVAAVPPGTRTTGPAPTWGHDHHLTSTHLALASPRSTHVPVSLAHHPLSAGLQATGGAGPVGLQGVCGQDRRGGARAGGAAGGGRQCAGNGVHRAMPLQRPLPTHILLQEGIKNGEARRAAAQRVAAAMKVRRAAGIQEATAGCPLDVLVGCCVPRLTPSTHHCPAFELGPWLPFA